MNKITFLNEHKLVSMADVVSSEGRFKVCHSVAGQSLTLEHHDPEELISITNEIIEKRARFSRYLVAWKDGVRLAPGLFNIPVDGIDSALDIFSLSPNYNQDELASLEGQLQYFGLAMWSFWKDPEGEGLKLFSLSELATHLSIYQREVISQLLINYDNE